MIHTPTKINEINTSVGHDMAERAFRWIEFSLPQTVIKNADILRQGGVLKAFMSLLAIVGVKIVVMSKDIGEGAVIPADRHTDVVQAGGNLHYKRPRWHEHHICQA